MLQLDGTPHGLGVLPRASALSKKSLLQQALQERAKPAWSIWSGAGKKKDLQHSFTIKVILKCQNVSKIQKATM